MGMKIFFWIVSFVIIFPSTVLASGKSNEPTNISTKGLMQKVQDHRNRKVMKHSSNGEIDLSKVKDREILVKIKNPGQFNAKRHGLIRIETPNPIQKRNYRVVQVPKAINYEQKLVKLRKNPLVQSAVPNFIQQVKLVPNDPKYGRQWYLKTINMPKAWNLPTGSSNVVVAVLDTGVDIHHPDLQGKLILNQRGQDIINNDSTPEDTEGHGTHVAGIIAAKTNNKMGIASVGGYNSNIKILPVKIANGAAFSLANAVSGIYYATNHGADVINMSFGSYLLENPYYDPNYDPLYDAVWFAHNHGVVLVAAAGNSNHGTYDPSYPASYAPVISVAATNRYDQRAPYSDYGNWVDVAAPGGTLNDGILSTALLGGYNAEAGTSFSAPIVSGLAALMKSKHPGWGPSKIEWAIEQGAKEATSSEWRRLEGYGRVDAYHSLILHGPYLGNDVSNTIKQAKSRFGLLSGHKQSEKINIPGDLDVYKFYVNKDTRVTIKLSDVSYTMDLVGILGTPTGTQIFDHNGKGGGESYTFQAQQGMYYVGVFDNYNHWSNYPYKINVTIADPAIKRIAGANRFGTAVRISRAGWFSANTVVLARGYYFPDALAGAPLAHKLKAPILLTRSDRLPNITKREIRRLGANKVVLLGGPKAISSNVVKSLKNMGIHSIRRIGGATRFETANAISDRLKQLEGKRPQKAVVVYGYQFPDALTIASYAAKHGYPILLVRTNRIPEKTKAKLDQFNQTIVVGGTSVVDKKVYRDLKHMGCSPIRIAGANRFETGKAVVEKLGLPTDKAFVAAGYEYPDALTGSVLVAKEGGSLILVRNDEVTDTTKKLINEKNMTSFTILGGHVAVNDHAAKGLIY